MYQKVINISTTWLKNKI